MFAKSVIAAAFLSISASAAFAADYSAPFANVASSSTLTRAAVQQELYRAQAAGEVVSGEYYGSLAPAKSTRSRADVVRDLRQAQAAGQIVSGELYGQPPVVVATNTSREQIRADAIAFARQQAHSHSTLEFIGG